MLPKRRRVRAGSPHSALASSTPPAARFPGVAIYLAEPRMGRSRRAFLTRLARSKGFRILDAYRCAAPARARRWGDASLVGGWCNYARHPSAWPRTGAGAQLLRQQAAPAALGSKPALVLRGCGMVLQPGVPLFERMPSSQRLLKEPYKEGWLMSNIC